MLCGGGCSSCPYPCYGHDAQSEQAGSQQVPQAVAVELQSHGQRHRPQQIQHLDARKTWINTCPAKTRLTPFYINSKYKDGCLAEKWQLSHLKTNADRTGYVLCACQTATKAPHLCRRFLVMNADSVMTGLCFNYVCTCVPLFCGDGGRRVRVLFSLMQLVHR